MKNNYASLQKKSSFWSGIYKTIEIKYSRGAKAKAAGADMRLRMWKEWQNKNTTHRIK